jgi:Ca2+-binding EF-hand superfamily protein
MATGLLFDVFKDISDAVEKKSPATDTTALFTDFDRGRTGAVSKLDLAETFGARFDLHLDDRTLDLLLLKFDADGGGSLDSDEFTNVRSLN